jgi:hypothetical protein
MSFMHREDDILLFVAFILLSSSKPDAKFMWFLKYAYNFILAPWLLLPPLLCQATLLLISTTVASPPVLRYPYFDPILRYLALPAHT